MASGDNLKDLLLLYRSIEQQYKLDQYTTESLKQIQKALDIARQQLFDEIGYRDIIMPKDRVDMVLEELNNLTLGVQYQLSQNIQDAAVVAGEYSYREYDKMLSFDGKLDETVGFNHVSVSPEQIRAMVTTVPVGGKLLEGWVKDTFELRIQEEIQTAILADTFQGLSTPKIIRHMESAFGMIRNDAETLVRTYLQSINNQAAEAVYKANSDIIKQEEWCATLEVGLSGKSTCLRCASLDKKTFDINSEHVRPPLHPRCVTADSIIFAPDMTHLMESKYSGPIVKLTLSDGTTLSITSQHMLMTPNGLVMARFITDRDYLLSCGEFKGVIFGDPNDNRNNLRIDNVVKSFSKNLGVVPTVVPTSPEYFHGDGIFGQKHVNIIDANRFLVNNINAKFLEHFTSNALPPVDFASILFSYGLIAKFFKGFLDSTHRRIGVSREFFSFSQWCLRHSEEHGFTPSSWVNPVIFEKFSNWRPACSKFFGDLIDGHVVIKEFDNHFSVEPKVLMVDRISEWEPFPDKSSLDSVTFCDACKPGYIGEIPIGHVNFVKIENVDIVHVKNLSVYDVSTLSSSYIVNGVLSSNCRCFMLPKTLSYRELGLNIPEMKESLRPYSERADKRAIVDAGQFDGDFEKFLFSRDQKYQLDLLGPNRLRLIQEGKIKFSDLVDKDGNIRLLKKGKDGNYVGLE